MISAKTNNQATIAWFTSTRDETILFIAFDKKIETWSRNKDFIDIGVVPPFHLVSLSVKEHFYNALVNSKPP